MAADSGEAGRAVVVHGWSLPLTLAAFAAIRRAGAVYIARRTPLREPAARRRRRILGAIARINPRARVHVVSVEDVSSHLWPANRHAVDRAAALEPEIKRSAVYRALRDLTGSESVVKYFQASLAIALPNHALLGVQCAFAEARASAVDCVPAFEHARGDGMPRRRHGPAYSLYSAGCIIRARLLLLLMPMAFVVSRLRHGLRLRAPRRFKAAVPVVWGVQRDDAAAAVRRPHDDLYLYGGRFQRGDLVHVFGDWSFDAATRAGFDAEFARRDLPVADKRRFGLDPRTAWLAMRATLRLVSVALAPRRFSWLDELMLAAAPKAIYYWLAKHVELAHIRVSAELVKNDYNPAHVMSTIVLNQHGAAAIGVQHAAAPIDSPQLAFVHVDRYVVFGELFVRAFGTRWASLPLERAGRDSVDWVHDAMEPARRAGLRARWSAKHGDARKTVLVLFPGANDLCLVRQWNEIYCGLDSLRETPGDFRVVLRFRTAASMRAPHVARFAELPSRDPRFVVELAEFTTYELIAVSDVVIAGEASFTVNEALAAVPVVFTFEYVGTASYYFRDYGRDLVLRTASDVRRVFDALDTGFGAFDCDWDALRRDANYHTDGHNRRRLREAVEAAAMRSTSVAVPVATFIQKRSSLR